MLLFALGGAKAPTLFGGHFVFACNRVDTPRDYLVERETEGIAYEGSRTKALHQSELARFGNGQNFITFQTP